MTGLAAEDPLLDFLPACLGADTGFCGKCLSAAGDREVVFCVFCRIAQRCQESRGNQRQHLLFPGGKLREVRRADIRRRDNGMMIADLMAVQDTIRICRQGLHEAEFVPQLLCQTFRAVAHFIRQIPAVGTGIGDQLLLIKALGIIQGLLGGESIIAVGIPLQ